MKHKTERTSIEASVDSYLKNGERYDASRYAECLDLDYLDELEGRRSAIERAIADHETAVRASWEAEYYRRKYNELLDSSIKHSDAMNANLLIMALNGNLVPKPLPEGVEHVPFPGEERP